MKQETRTYKNYPFDGKDNFYLDESDNISVIQKCLESGGQISNGPQYITWSPQNNWGYMCCDTEGCCDFDFESIQEIMDFIKGNNEWFPVVFDLVL